MQDEKKLERRDRIKGLKLLCINAYCGAAAEHKILFYPSCTAACLLRLPQYTRYQIYSCRSTRGIKSILCTAACVLRRRSLPLQLPVQSELCRNLSRFILSLERRGCVKTIIRRSNMNEI